jgi:aryl-alcohol dehydrogenase-like predicted oxidoreductase
VPVVPGIVALEDPGRPGFGLGCVNLGRHGRNGIRVVHQALDLGISFFDTADAYGNGESERILGRGLRRRRHEAFIATKAGYTFRERSLLASAARPLLEPARGWVRSVRPEAHSPRPESHRARVSYGEQNFSPKYLRGALEASMRRLGTDFVDLYQLHGPREVHDDVVALMTDLRSEGKVGGCGVGLESLRHAMDWIKTGLLTGIQVPFGLLDPEAGKQVIPRAATEGLSVIVRGVFAGGFVARPSGDDVGRLRPGQPERLAALREMASSAKVSTMQLAVWFATAQPGVSTVLVGTSSVAHLEELARCFDTTPSPHVLQRLAAFREDSRGT